MSFVDKIKETELLNIETMNCKNCKLDITENDNYCPNCGAKVIKERITIKSLFSNLLHALGWDSNFFVTLRFLLLKPQTILKEYINGTRKKYTNPFTFFAISLAISLFVFSQFSDQFVQMSVAPYIQQTEQSENTSTPDINNKGFRLFGYANKAEFMKANAEFQLNYYNLISFLFLPLLALITFIVFGKPYNYGEHLVINTYISTITTFLGVLLFIVSLLVNIDIFGMGVLIIMFLYYSYVYKNIYELTFWQLLVKILKFFGILIIFFIITFLIGIAMIKSKI